MSRLEPPARDKETFVTGLARGLDVIRAFTADRPTMTLSEAADVTGLSPAVVRRSLLTLVQLGYAGQDQNQFFLRPAILELGASYLASLNAAEVIQPTLQQLLETTGDTVTFSVLDKLDIVTLAYLPTRRLIREVVHTGSRVPAHLVPSGRVILSTLKDDELASRFDGVAFDRRTDHTVDSFEELLGVLHRVKDDGFAIVQDELEYGLTGIAVPVLGPDQVVIAGVGCAMASAGHQRSDLVESRLPALQLAARQIQEQIHRLPNIMALVMPSSAGGN